jgi:hypothetical protein
MNEVPDWLTIRHLAMQVDTSRRQTSIDLDFDALHNKTEKA